MQLLEQRHDASFSYLENDVSSISIEAPSIELSFRESITFLKRNTPLSYSFISEKQIAISKLVSKNTLCGQVITSDITPIPGALVKSGSIQTLTDTDGFFRVDDTTQDGFTISYPGYQKINISKKNSERCPLYILSPEVQSLSEVIITDFVAKGIDRKSDGSTEVTFSEMGVLPGVIESDVLLTTLALPGVQSINERVSDLNIRGGTHDQNLFLWDGIKMYQSGHFFGLISAFNTYATDEVTIYKNGTPTRYADGVSGTLVMESQKTIQDSLRAIIDINLINAGAFIDIPLGKRSSLQYAGRKSLSSLAETPTYSQYFDRTFQDTEVTQSSANAQTTIDDELFSFFDSSIRWIFQPTEKDKIQLNALVVGNELSFRESTRINNTRERQGSSITQNNLAGGLLYERDWGKGFFTLGQVYVSNYTLKGTNVDLINNQRLIQTNDVLEDGLRLETIFKKDIRKQWTLGYNFNETGVTNIQDINNPQFKRSVKEVVRSHGFYASYDYTSPDGSSRLITGTRAQYYDKLDILSLEPRISYSQEIVSGLSLEAAIERKSQATSQTIEFQSDFLGIESRRWILANREDIPLIQSNQFSAGLSYNKKKWLISSELYYKMVQGITVQSQGFQNQLQFVRSTGDYETMGIEVLMNKRWNSFNFRAGYSYALNDYNFTDLPTDGPATFPNRVDVRHTIKTAVGYDGKRLGVSTGLNWHTGRPSTPLSREQPVVNNGLNYEFPNSARLPQYARWDASSRYTFHINNMQGEVALSIWNILGKVNVLDRYFLLNVDSPARIEESSLGFTPNLSFKMIF